ncbi:delta-lactam-biosynthetic de-N-acetylase [Paraclostridium sordellii]|uniref:delta-lactam-biosynthetic de-N-acetylase n=1 Tax=Paraclostridium sordellii TaxID=1505 RepID=UPI0005E7B604|nr:MULTISPECIES: delta-lactam-biosynthetic de-N-acetylase [Paeniclostridium]MBW4862819.1 delta-lactam-biosynthetic de-N-acetylase [Paeniclostridium sp.]CEN93142.1 delta-lactam-biosynthetic de-N-acteylase [[Clostridium] sordellii] [Paeniclostridium sordellii]CEN95650.1 delta-lactam-biosynthetic de-N-acteylase [[Clostridium] sordellii] [Paeniclostridium sordellii]
MNNNTNIKNSFFIITIFVLAGFLISGEFGIFDKLKTQIFNPNSQTKEYNWYFNPRNDGKQPTPIKEASFFNKYGAYYVGDPKEKVIYLTFDAGYESGNTEKLLDTLKKHKVPAAFFVVDHYLKTNPDMVKRMVDEGHLVCNHSKRHPSMASITDFEKFKEEINSVEESYKEITGKDMPKFFRPPMGKFSELSLKYTQDLGYNTIFWSFAYVDWYEDKQPSHEEAKEKIFSRTHPGAIVLLHPNSTTNTEILDEVITHWKKEGYTLKSLAYLTNKKTSDKSKTQILDNK